MTSSMSSTNPGVVQAIIWRGEQLDLLDQRRLPHETRYLHCASAAEVAAAIHAMVVRGAPAIGIAAAWAMVLAAQAGADLAAAEKTLADSRPTAVNLAWALARMRVLAAQTSAQDLATVLAAEAQRIQDEDLAQNHRMAEFGAALLPAGARVLTHCNTGALATAGHGTALGVIRTAHAQGKLAQVYAGETRPWLQGARLTAWELQQEQIPVKLLVDGAAASLMARGLIDWVIIGADRIAANGDTVNKIGSYALACAAQINRIPLMVVAPSGTFDLHCADGAAIPIEDRGPAEICSLNGQPIAAQGTQTVNPVFDVTPAQMIEALVCELGVARNPDRAKVAQLLGGRSPE